MSHPIPIKFRRARYLRWTWVALLAVTVAWGTPAIAQPTNKPSPKSERPAPTLADYEVSSLKLGGDFTLTNQDGQLISLQRFRGKAVLLFFGYTYCPDVCPVTLAKVARLRHNFGRRGTRIQAVFVSIDPERDTPARLKAYVAAMDPSIVALTGSAAQVEAAAALYRARYDKEEGGTKDTYFMAHTAYLYAVDAQGKLRYVFPPDVDNALLASGVKKLLPK